jgi:hypothetical protein
MFARKVSKALWETEANLCASVETVPSGISVCWGELLLLRMADRELYRMKSIRKIHPARQSS